MVLIVWLASLASRLKHDIDDLKYSRARLFELVRAQSRAGRMAKEQAQRELAESILDFFSEAQQGYSSGIQIQALTRVLTRFVSKVKVNQLLASMDILVRGRSQAHQ